MDLIWCSVVKTFSWAQVHHSNFSLYVVIRNFCNILALREIFSKQAISILVRAPLSRLVRLRKIEWQAIQIFGHICMAGKFFAPVRRYRQGFGTKKQINHCPADCLSISSGDHWHSSSLCFTCSKSRACSSLLCGLQYARRAWYWCCATTGIYWLATEFRRSSRDIVPLLRPILSAIAVIE